MLKELNIFINHGVTVGTITITSIISFIVAYNSIVTALIVTIALILNIRKLYKTFWHKD